MTRDPSDDRRWETTEIAGHGGQFLEAQKARKEREQEELAAERYEIDLERYTEVFVEAGGTAAAAKAEFEKVCNELAAESAREAHQVAETASKRHISQTL